MEIVTDDQLDFTALINHLSTHSSFPCCQHIRNHFLAQYGTFIKHPRLIEKEVDDDPWQTYHDYRKDAIVAAIGDVPNSIRKGYNQQDESAKEGVWALVTVFPSYSPGWVNLSKDEQDQCNSIWNAIRTTFWISTERPFEQYTTPDQVRQATIQESNLLKFIFEHHLPTAIGKLASDLPPFANIKKHNDDEQFTLSDLHAINHIWMKELQVIQDKNDSWKMVRCNPCVTFTMPEENALQLKQNVEVGNRWRLSLIGDHPGELEMVVNSNNIKYPTFYPKARRHLSVMLYDQEGIHEEAEIKSDKKEYPKTIHPGAPAGWAYSHDDFSLGSLHVSEPYRRLKKSKGVHGLGTICLALMAETLVKIQRDALRFAGCDDFANLPTPIISDAEEHKQVAVAFHRSAGFVPKTITSWGAYAVQIK